MAFIPLRSFYSISYLCSMSEEINKLIHLFNLEKDRLIDVKAIKDLENATSIEQVRNVFKTIYLKLSKISRHDISSAIYAEFILYSFAKWLFDNGDYENAIKSCNLKLSLGSHKLDYISYEICMEIYALQSNFSKAFGFAEHIESFENFKSYPASFVEALINNHESKSIPSFPHSYISKRKELVLKGIQSCNDIRKRQMALWSCLDSATLLGSIFYFQRDNKHPSITRKFTNLNAVAHALQTVIDKSNGCVAISEAVRDRLLNNFVFMRDLKQSFSSLHTSLTSPQSQEIKNTEELKRETKSGESLFYRIKSGETMFKYICATVVTDEGPKENSEVLKLPSECREGPKTIAEWRPGADSNRRPAP